jgi:secreted trypsin-like serine protease
MAFTIKTMSSFLIICLNVLLHLVRGFEAFKATSNYEREVIVAGTDIPKGNFPYLAYIWYYNDEMDTKFCGGTLIDPNWILTSFGCVREAVSPAIAIHAVVGAHRKEEIDLCDHINVECHIISQENLFVNPNFNKVSWEYDFALLYLHNPSNFSTVKINTDTNVPVEKDKVTVAGWGSAKDSNNDNYYPDVSQEAELEVISRDACLQKYQNVPLTTNMQCVTGYGTSAFCRGDFGGPVIMKSNASSDILVGIMSWTGSSGCTKVPNVYGRVSSAAPWINSKITSIAPSKAPVSSKKLTPQLKRMPSSTPTTAANTDKNPTEQPTTTAKPLTPQPMNAPVNSKNETSQPVKATDTTSEIPSLPPTKAQMLSERPTPKRTEAAVTPECVTSQPTKVNLTSLQGALASRSAHPTLQVTKTDLNVQKSTKLEFTVIFIVVGVVIGATIIAVFFGMSNRERHEENFEIQKEDVNRQDHQITENNTPPSTVELKGTNFVSNLTLGFSI